MRISVVQDAMRTWAYKTNEVATRIAQTPLISDGGLTRVQAALVVIDEQDPELATNAVYLVMKYAREFQKGLARTITPDMSLNAIQLEKQAIMDRYKELTALEERIRVT